VNLIDDLLAPVACTTSTHVEDPLTMEDLDRMINLVKAEKKDKELALYESLVMLIHHLGAKYVVSDWIPANEIQMIVGKNVEVMINNAIASMSKGGSNGKQTGQA